VSETVAKIPITGCSSGFERKDAIGTAAVGDHSRLKVISHDTADLGVDSILHVSSDSRRAVVPISPASTVQ
jgi:hypothetical protein